MPAAEAAPRRPERPGEPHLGPGPERQKPGPVAQPERVLRPERTQQPAAMPAGAAAHLPR